MSRMPPLAHSQGTLSQHVLDFHDFEKPLIPIGLRPYCKNGCAVIRPDEPMTVKFSTSCQKKGEFIMELFAEDNFATFANVTRGAHEIALECEPKGGAFRCTGAIPVSNDSFTMQFYSTSWAAVYSTEIQCGENVYTGSPPLAVVVMIVLGFIGFMMDVFFRRY